ncbi:MAG: hypothetical protein EYC70_10710 [Planctomycetota bacterium]|nr:MAG: hypothetical protein EYC70_10710 [Planctomycetota bacterium]
MPTVFQPFTTLLRGTAKDLLQFDTPLWLTRAPGRLDVLGGPAESPGSASLQVSIARSVYCAVQNRQDQKIFMRCLLPASQGGTRFWEGDVGSLYTKKGPPRSLAVLRQSFGAPDKAWMMEIIAAMLGLRRTRQLNTPKHGFTMVIWSRLPEEPGYGQDAAFGTAVALAFKASTGLARKRVDGIQVAKAVVQGAREVLERNVPIADALTSALGRRNCAMYIEHGLEPAMQWIPLPQQCVIAAVDIAPVGSVSAADRCAAEAGAGMALVHLSAALKRDKKMPVPGWGKVNPSEFDEAWKGLIPVEEQGSEWLKHFKRGHEDIAATVDKDRSYRLRSLAEHHVHESERVRRFVSNLSEFSRSLREGFLGEAGRTLQRSTQSLEDKCGFHFVHCGPFLSAIKEAGREEGLFGARPSECGRHGIVAVLLHQAARQPLRELAEQHRAPGKVAPTVISDTEDGGALNCWWEGILEPKEGQVLTAARPPEAAPVAPAEEPRRGRIRPEPERRRDRGLPDYSGDYDLE